MRGDFPVLLSTSHPLTSTFNTIPRLPALCECSARKVPPLTVSMILSIASLRFLAHKNTDVAAAAQRAELVIKRYAATARCF